MPIREKCWLRRTAERAPANAHSPREVTSLADEVPDMPISGRARERAARLHHEALNCLTFAVSEGDEAHAAELIDEAVRLEQRSRELARG